LLKQGRRSQNLFGQSLDGQPPRGVALAIGFTEATRWPVPVDAVPVDANDEGRRREVESLTPAT
jgi:hypothetical protein